MLTHSYYRYFKRKVNIFCEFIPQMIFLNFIFGELVCIVLYCMYHHSATGQSHGGSVSYC